MKGRFKLFDFVSGVSAILLGGFISAGSVYSSCLELESLGSLTTAGTGTSKRENNDILASKIKNPLDNHSSKQYNHTTVDAITIFSGVNIEKSLDKHQAKQ